MGKGAKHICGRRPQVLEAAAREIPAAGGLPVSFHLDGDGGSFHVTPAVGKRGDDFVIKGQKVVASNGHLCNLIVLATKTDASAGANGITPFLVESDRPGFTHGRNLEELAMKARDTSELFFDNVHVPAANMPGDEYPNWSPWNYIAKPSTNASSCPAAGATCGSTRSAAPMRMRGSSKSSAFRSKS